MSRVGRWAARAAVVLVAWAGAPLVAGAGTPPLGWSGYHGPRGDGVAVGYTRVDTARPLWRSGRLDGQLYGQPVVDGARVIVATEADVVYALSASSGRVVWSRRVGAAVPAAALPCGDITPTVGITGTPVVDPARGEVFVVADEWSGGRARHVLVGLDVASGRVELSEVVDPPRSDPAAALQRTGLALDAGRVVFGFGGNYGDCGAYRGRLVSVPEGGGPARVFTVDARASEREGAIWMGGAAPVVDAAGDVWVEVGNGSSSRPGQPYDRSDAVLELSSSLRLRQLFAPADWARENAADEDLSAAPALVGSYVVASGKDGNAYLLSRDRLGGIGHPLDVLGRACAGAVDGGVAVVGTKVVLPCADGPVAVAVVGGRLVRRWSATVGGGPPVVAAGRVWTVGPDGVLYGLDPVTGRVRQRARVGAVANHFPTPAVVDGALLVPVSQGVVAYAARRG